MKISVVVPTYNRRALLRQALSALLVQDYRDFEILVVDDASSDGTPELVREEFPQVRYLRHATNRGVAAARNTGIGAAGGEIVASTDDDCAAPMDWLSSLAGGYRRYPEVAGVGGYMEAPESLLRCNPLAQYESYLSRVVYGVSEHEYIGGCECPAGGTNNMSYWKRILEVFGGFDESFPSGADPELKLRICRAGHRLLFVPARMMHHRPYTWQSFRQQQIQRGRGVAHFERKHRRPLSPARVALRAGKRSLCFAPDCLQLGPSMAWVKLWAGWYQCWGQLLEMKRLRHSKPAG